MASIKELKEEYKNNYVDEEIPTWKIYLLMHMAENDIYPDGSFSDVECSLWSNFRLMKGKRGN